MTTAPIPTHYRSTTIDGIDLFYREAGPQNAPVVLLLHGFPSSSRGRTATCVEPVDSFT